MPIFVLFVFAAVVFGAGSMLAPALPTRSPRIGLAGALALAFVVTGSIFYAAAFGWNTLIIDYLWFAVIVGIFFAGTLSAGMFRAEASGGTKEYTGWPGPNELAFFILVAVIFAVPALIVPVPLDTDAQGFGYLALMLKLGGSLTNLSPFHPTVNYLYSPGIPALVAYLGTQLHAGLQNIQLAVGVVLSVLFVWIAYDFGNEISVDMTVDHGDFSRRLGIAFAVCAVIGTGLFTAVLDSHYTALLGLVFSLAFLTFALRFHREGKWQDFLGAAVCLAGVPLSQPDMTIILMLGYIPYLFTLWFANPTLLARPSLFRWLGLAVGIPLLAVIGISPWLSQILPLLGADIRTPFAIDTRHFVVLFAYHGGVVVLLAMLGLLIRFKARSAIDLMMLVWLVLIIDFSSLGLIKAILPWLPIFKYDYPFSIAWHGAIIPYLYFGGHGILWIIDRLGRDRAERLIRRVSPFVINGIALIVVVIGIYAAPIVKASKSTSIAVYGTFSTKSDVEAMTWLKDNTPADTIVLNHPGDHEGDWVPIIAQRNTIFFRPQPFFQHMEQIEATWAEFKEFWKNPGDPAFEALLKRYNVKYVIVPQIVNKPDLIKTDAFRWKPPVPDAQPYLNPIKEMPYLKLIQDFDGAQVWEVR